MKFSALFIASLFLLNPALTISHAQQATSLNRLPKEVLDITPPSARVVGVPGVMRITERACRALPLEDVRRRIVNAAVQEWAFFGFNIEDQTRIDLSAQNNPVNNTNTRRRLPAMSSTEAARLADSIGGYWSATPDSDWILQRQNQAWASDGIQSRWRDAWSAAFISWVMCESGLGDNRQFKRAIAHHSYIDQAILARDDKEAESVYAALEPGEAAVIPGDLLCRGSRPAYRSIAERRDQLGVGARTHCDIVVNVDTANSRIMVIGGNVRGSVRMKLLPTELSPSGQLRAVSDGGRVLFAHLKLRTAPIEDNALKQSPTLLAMNCQQLPSAALSLVADLKSSQAGNCG